MAEVDSLNSVDEATVTLCKVLYAIYLVVAGVLLMNMMIALLSNTYQRVEVSINHYKRSVDPIKIHEQIQNFVLENAEKHTGPCNSVTVLLKRFNLNGNTVGSHQHTQQLELQTNKIVSCEMFTAEWSHHRNWSQG